MADDQGKMKQFSMTQLLRDAQPSDDRVLERELRNLRTVVEPDILTSDVAVQLTETLLLADTWGKSTSFRSVKLAGLAGSPGDLVEFY